VADEKWVDGALIGAVDAGNFDAKGDLLVGTADNTFDNLPAGTAGEILIPLSTESTGLEWFTVGSDGDVLVPKASAARGLEWMETLTYAGQVLTKGGKVLLK